MLDAVNSILVDFSILYDTDIGSALYLYTNSKNKEFFEDYLKEATYDFFKFQALTRSEQNPIKYLFKDEYKDSADDIYKDLIETKWDKVLKCSPLTDILPALIVTASQYGIVIQVNCTNKEEEAKFRTVSTWETFINKDITTGYNTLYLKDIREILKLDVVGKVVYLYDYSLNYLNCDMAEKAIHEIAIPFSNTTQFKFISPFKDFVLPEGYRGNINSLRNRIKENL